MTEKTSVAGRAIVITGASTGIGFHTAEHLAKLGYLVFAGVRKAADADRLQAASSQITPLTIDVTDEQSIAKAVETVAAKGVPLIALVNNAGVVVAGPIEALEMKRIREQFEVNVFGLLAVTKAFLPLLRQKPGRIINISSIAGRTVTPMLSPYCASKHAVEVFSDALRVELQPDGIRVVLIEPGSIDTPIWDKSIKMSNSDVSEMDPGMIRRYDTFIRGMQVFAEKSAKAASPVQTVVAAITEAIESRVPRARYLVGRDAKLALLVQAVPDYWRDKIFMKAFKSAAKSNERN